jgi:tRNA nucleotidyltransferase/poly(A) polymerase
MGELSKLLLGAHPARALRIARDTGVLVALLPEFQEAIGFEQRSRYHELTVDEHTFAVVQAAADAGAPLQVRLAALFHDLGKPRVAWLGGDGRLHFYRKPGYSNHNHEEISAELATSALSRLRYPTDVRKRVVAIVRAHMFNVGRGDALRARRMLARYGDELTFDLLDHKEADVRGKRAEATETQQGEIEKLQRFRQIVRQELASPHRLGDLAVDGRDLLALGYRPGPAIGRTLRELLKEVVEDPARNERETLLRLAEALR